MNESQDKTVVTATPPPQELSLARLKTSLESAHRNSASALAKFLAERSAASPTAPGSPTRSSSPVAYDLGRIVAQGGMGAILSARDNAIERTVAVKVILTGAEASDEHVHRLITEARITGQLEHPNIVPLHELGVTADGVVYYTMRLVEGTTLSELLERIRQKDGPTLAKYPLRSLLTIFQKICDAVAFAHSRGVIHRDLKPDNIMVGEFGEAFVMDWGLAKRLRGGDADGSTTHIQSVQPLPSSNDSFKTLLGQVKGTPRYMAPEQAEGRVDDIDERTDIYALGAILYTILTLHPPVGGDTVNEVLTRVASGAIHPPTSYNPCNTRITRGGPALTVEVPIAPTSLAHCPDRRVPAALSAVAMKALARDSEKRYQTVAALQQDIAAYQGGFATTAERANAFRLLLLLIGRHRTEVALVITALGIMAGMGFHFTNQVTRTLAELKETAPTFYGEAKSLVDELKFGQALAKLNYAISLQPDDARFHALKGNIFQSLLQLADARDAYARALELDTELQLPHAERNLRLCEKLLADNVGQATLKPESLAELRISMVRQQRSAEAVAMATREHRSGPQVLDSWRTLVQKIGLNATVRREGSGLSLVVNQPEFNDLTPFRGAPFSRVQVADTQLADLEPLRLMPLQSLDLSNTRVAELSPLRGLALLRLDLSRTRAMNFSVLRGMPLTTLNLSHTRIADLTVLRAMPLRHLQLEGCTNIVDLTPLAECRQLEGLILPVGTRNLEPVRALPKLKHIGYTMAEGGWERVPTAENFWKINEPRVPADPRPNGK